MLDIPDGTQVFIDASIFHYALVPTMPFSEQCVGLMNRCLTGRVTGVTGTFVLSDVLHKVALSEVVAKTGQPRSGLLAWLKKHPSLIGELRMPSVALQELRRLPLVMIPLDLSLLSLADEARQLGLMTTDAIIVAAMRRGGISQIATNDDDFDRVPGLSVWKPR